MLREFYSYSLFPAVSNQSPCLFSKSSKLHTKLREHRRMDFAGKEADMVLEKERSNLFFVSVEVRRVEEEKTGGPPIACNCQTLLYSLPSNRAAKTELVVI